MNRSKRGTVLLLSALVMATLAATASLSSSHGRTPTTHVIQEKAVQEKKAGRESSEGAVPDIFNEEAEPADPQQRAERQAKNKRYERFGAETRPLTDPEVSGRGTTIDSQTPAALPVAESSDIFIGQVVQARSYFSEYKTSIYTEFTVQVQQVFQSNSQARIEAGSKIIVTREGGGLRLRDGRVVVYEVGGLGRMPRPGRQYLFFLKPVHENQDLSIVESYEIRDGRIFPSRRRPNYEGLGVDTLISELRAELQRKGGRR